MVNGVDSARGYHETQDNGNVFSVYIGRIINLQKRDKLAVKTVRTGGIEYDSDHSFFGTFRIM